MKKLLVLIFLFFIFCTKAFSSENLSFVYINGSNNNDVKMKNWYEKGVKKLHPVMRKKILTNKDIKKANEPYGGLNIKEDPVIFFWGYDSKNDLDFVKERLEISKMVSSTGAYVVRSLTTQFLHDAIWVQKEHNMLPILDSLNEQIKKENENGNSVILYGYSAGTFITYEYLFNKLRYINIEQLFDLLGADNDIMAFVKENPQNNTCLSALSHSSVGTMTSQGHFAINPNKELLRESYLKLNDATEKVCAPVDKIRGVVNFASPLVLFYSDMADDDYDLNYYNGLLIKYVIENGIFMLTVNFKEDPLGFPSSRNLTIEDIEKITGMTFENPTGVIYDNSGVWSKRMFPFAHTAYWSARGTFANAVAKSIVNGYKFQYDEEYRMKVIKRHSKKSEL